MNTISRWVATLSLLLGSVAASAQTTTYAFTGVVTSSNTTDLVAGQYVTGTYTLTYNGADQIIGNFPNGPSNAPWVIGSTGVPYNPVFASLVQVVKATVYSSSTTAPPSDPDDASAVSANGFSTLSASEGTPAFDLGSYFSIVEADIANGLPYTGVGAPVTLSTKQSASGGFVNGAILIGYEITSLTPTPAPPPATLFAKLLKDATGVGTETTLETLVELAQSNYNANNIPAACGAFTKFLHDLKVQNGTAIPATLDLSLTRQGQALAATIGCKD
jgi:hypothetical protein